MPTTEHPRPSAGTAYADGAPHPPHDPHDPHDHSGHEHPPTGADLVPALVRGLSVTALAIPAVGVAALVGSLGFAPSTPLVLVHGLLLGIAQLAVLVLTSLVVARRSARWAINPALQAGRSIVEELLRWAAVALAVVMMPGEDPARLGAWLGLGTALVWVALATAQTVAARRRIAQPGEWAEDAVATLLGGRVSVRRSMIMRVLDVVGAVCFQIGASMLIASAAIMVVPTIVLSFATAMSTLVLQRHPAGERIGSPWSYAPVILGVLTLLLGASAVALR